MVTPSQHVGSESMLRTFLKMLPDVAASSCCMLSRLIMLNIIRMNLHHIFILKIQEDISLFQKVNILVEYLFLSVTTVLLGPHYIKFLSLES